MYHVLLTNKISFQTARPRTYSYSHESQQVYVKREIKNCWQHLNLSASILLSSAAVKLKGELWYHCQNTLAITHTRQMASGTLKILKNQQEIHRRLKCLPYDPSNLKYNNGLERPNVQLGSLSGPDPIGSSLTGVLRSEKNTLLRSELKLSYRAKSAHTHTHTQRHCESRSLSIKLLELNLSTSAVHVTENSELWLSFISGNENIYNLLSC